MNSKAYIVVAEDDEDDRFLLQTAFDEKGYKNKIDFVENGVELIHYLNKIIQNINEIHFPGFIMLDLNMPKMDGRETLKEIKQHPVFKTIPVIIYTTTKNEVEIKRCYELGANTYVVKPVRFETLLTVVENIRSYWFNTASIPD